MRCLLQRRHIADLYDLVYPIIVGDIDVNRSEMISVFFRITIFGRSPGLVKGLLLDLPLEVLGRSWDKYLSFPKPGSFSFTNAAEAFASFINTLFPGAPIRERSLVFFPSALRNPIMEAADSMTLLRLRYSGVERLVEPYSLKFKIRRDGVGREYFYVYDTTGGRSSGPGIKTFVPDKVQAVENTDIEFEPRFDVELRKAGGAETTGHFESQGRSRGGWGRSSRRASTDYRYEVECPYCLRRFKRKRRDSKLRPHKDQFGNKCYGRRGHFV